MRNHYPEFKRGEVEEVYNKLSGSEQEFLKDYLVYRQARGIHLEDKLNDVRRYILHIRYILEKDLREMTLKDMREVLAIINNSRLSNNTKNHLKTDLANLLRYAFKDWSIRFNNFEDVRLDSSKTQERIDKNKVSQEDIDKLIAEEKDLFWKTFLMVQSEGGLRTIEARSIKWDEIKFNVDGEISEIFIPSTKTDKQRSIFVQEATYYLQRLEAEQKNLNNKGVYVFHSKKNVNTPIDKFSVSQWFRRLTKKVLGSERWAYLLRHAKATELYKLAKENKIAEDTAVKFMGHSKSMIDTYTHLDKEDVKKMLKDQLFKHKIAELPPEKKHEFEDKIKLLEQEMSMMKKMIEVMAAR